MHADVFLRLKNHKKRRRRRDFGSKAESKKTHYIKRKQVLAVCTYFPKSFSLVLLLKVGCRKSKTLARDGMVMGGQVF
jgi:hypothetical protein